MNVLRYFLKDDRLFLYAAVSAVLSLVMAVLLQAHWNILLYSRLFLLVLLILLLLRLADDYFDYEKDRERKEQPLHKRQLLLAMLVTMLLFVLLNLCFYRLSGLGSLCILAYLLLQQKAEILKVFFMPLASAYYFYVEQTSGMSVFAVSGYLVLCVGAAVLFSLFKRRRSG